MDAFFASVEQLDNPTLRNKPLIVGGDPAGRGVVAACSYEARRFGIHSAMSCAKAYRLCPNAVFVRPRRQRYKEISLQIMAIFKEYTDLVEPLSLDEAFLDITVNKKSIPSATWVGQAIRKEIFTKTGLTASAGISCNKFLAKVASDLNKPDGMAVIPPEQARDFIAALAIRKFYGVGKATEKKMHRLGIQTGRDLQRYSREELISHFGKNGGYFYDIARGIDEREVRPSRRRKSIGTETTFRTDLLDQPMIESVLGDFAVKVGETLQRHKMGGRTLTLKVRYHDFETVTRSVTPQAPLMDAEDILRHTPPLLKATEAGRRKIRLLGLSVANLEQGEDLHKQQCRQLWLPGFGQVNL